MDVRGHTEPAFFLPAPSSRGAIPAEWILARAYLKAGKFRECADLCEQALKRFPNHAGVLETLDKARSSGK
ncbi:tetratricopeptide repeat protein [Akkermansia muciniphila]|uniref:tetratricopeptide repeat protein n=1 Tax=Akkermansia muciniphila TaxID=239935 RepID=UPI000FE4103B